MIIHPRVFYVVVVILKPPREGLHPPSDSPASWKRQQSLENRLPLLPIGNYIYNENKHKLIIMGFLDSVKAGAKDLKESAKISMEISKLKGEIEDLQKRENAAYATIGRAAVAEFGLEKYGEDGKIISGLQVEIKAKQEALAAEEAKQKAAE